MADVFISYSSKDKKIADELCAQIEQSGLTCWMAPRNIIPGEDWAKSINTAITAAKVFVVVYSRNSCESTQVPKEIGIAGARNLPIIPYKIDSTPLEGDFEYYLLSSHWINADPNNGDYKMDEVLTAVNLAIARREGRDVSSVTINNNYAGDNNSVINVNGKSSVKPALKIAIGIGCALLLAAVVIIVLLLTGRGGADGSSASSDKTNSSVVSDSTNSSATMESASDAETEEVVMERLTYFAANEIYNEMINKLLDTVNRGAYTEFSAMFDDTYTNSEKNDLYIGLGYSLSFVNMDVSLIEYTDDAIFGAYTLYMNLIDLGMPAYYHSDYINKANILKYDGESWKFSELDKEHPLLRKINKHIYPYGYDSETNLTYHNYQTLMNRVLSDHFMAELVNVKLNDDDTLSLKYAIINGDSAYPSSLLFDTYLYYQGELLFSVEQMPLDTNMLVGDIKYMALVTEPIENADEFDLSLLYSESYLFAEFG